MHAIGISEQPKPLRVIYPRGGGSCHQGKAEQDPTGARGPQKDARRLWGLTCSGRSLTVLGRGDHRLRAQRGQAGDIKDSSEVTSMVSRARIPTLTLAGCATLGKLLNLSVSVPHL